MNDVQVGMFGEVEREYKRVVAMSSVKKGRAYWKGYLSALHFAMKVIKSNGEETTNENA